MTRFFRGTESSHFHRFVPRRPGFGWIWWYHTYSNISFRIVIPKTSFISFTIIRILWTFSMISIHGRDMRWIGVHWNLHMIPSILSIIFQAIFYGYKSYKFQNWFSLWKIFCIRDVAEEHDNLFGIQFEAFDDLLILINSPWSSFSVSKNLTLLMEAALFVLKMQKK